MAAIRLGELHRHHNQCRHQQDDTYPTKVRDPKERLLSATPLLDVAKAYSQKQCRNGKAADS